MDTDVFLNICKRIGLSTTELHELSIGQVQDLIVEYVKSEDQKNNPKNKARKATQADFDAF